MVTNAFLPFATATGANVETDSSYAADTLRTLGHQAGRANSANFNKAMRQATSVAAMVAQFIADNQASNVNDDGNTAGLETQFEAALFSNVGLWSKFNTLSNSVYTFTITASQMRQFWQTPTSATAAYSGTVVSAASVPQGSIIGIYNNSTSPMTLTSSNFNTAWGYGTSVVIGSNQSVILTSDGVSWNGIAGTGSIGNGNWPRLSVLSSTSTTLTSTQIGQYFQPPTGAASAYTVGLTSTSSVPAGSNIGFFNSGANTLTINSPSNFNTAYGSGTTSIVIPSGGSIILTNDGVSWNGTAGAGTIGAAVKPQSASGVGQWQGLIPTGTSPNQYLTLPSGGTWVYFGYVGTLASTVGIAAGGTNVIGPNSFTGLLAAGFCWRIA